MLSLLLSLLIALIVMSVVYWILTMVLAALPLPPVAKQIALAVCALIFLIWFLGAVGLWGDPVGWRLYR